MPQIAQQDYIVIKNEYRDLEKVNCHCLAKLRQCLENNTLFDVLFEIIPANPSEDIDFPTITRIVSHDTYFLRYHKVGGTLDLVSVGKTVGFYEFSAAIQDAYLNKEGSFPNAIPDLVRGDADELIWAFNDNWTITNNGRKIILTTDDEDHVVSYSLGDEDSGEYTLDIPDDVMPDLIGMMIS